MPTSTTPAASEDMPPKNLLLCFDAFGTLFRPRQPVPQQYIEVAKSVGLGGFSSEDVGRSFKEAFKKEARENPNFGKANGMNPEKWWSNIINHTFEPLIGSKDKMPAELVPRLLKRFWCDEGYCLHEDALPLITQLREAHKASNTRVLVGVITNSDDRVPDILISLGMQVSPLRYGTRSENVSSSWQDDIDFSVMSYDVGHEKPDRRIFAAAEALLQTKLQGEGGVTEDDRDPDQWRKVYVGDEYNKDVVGALDAGWNAVLIDRETTRGRKDVDWLDPKPPGDLWNTFKTSKAVGFGSLEKLAEWLPGRI